MNMTFIAVFENTYKNVVILLWMKADGEDGHRFGSYGTFAAIRGRNKKLVELFFVHKPFFPQISYTE